MRSRKKSVLLFFHVWCMVTLQVSGQVIIDRKYGIELPKQVASGGTLTLSIVPPASSVIELSTKRGESSESVISRLARAASGSSIFKKNNGFSPTSSGRVLAALKGSELCGLHVFGGTDLGPMIPPAPTSLSVSYNVKKDSILISWDNGDATYTSVACPVQGLPSWTMKGDHYRRDFSTVSAWPGLYTIDNFTVAVVGYQGRTPSNAGLMHLRGNRQEELYALPFSGGIAPNWRSWRISSQDASTRFEEGVHPAKSGRSSRYQILAAEGRTEESRYDFGLCRKFFDLEPGARYRFGMKMKFAVSDANAEWSVYATFLERRDQRFTARQLSEEKAPGAGDTRKLFSHSAKEDSLKKWTLMQTGGNDCPDIEIPAGCETVLFWMSMKGGETGKVTAAFDGVFLEQLPRDDTRQ